MAQSTISVSRIARAGARIRMADPDTGFNPRLTSALESAGITVPLAVRLPINFESGSVNFFEANITFDDLADTSTVSNPYVTLYSRSAVNQNRIKFHAFSGVVQLGIGLYIGWIASRAMSDMESVADSIEESMVGTFNGEDVAEWAQQYDTRLLYNGDISVARGPLVIDEENWSQAFQFTVTVEVHARG